MKKQKFFFTIKFFHFIHLLFAKAFVRVNKAHLRLFLELFFTRKGMGLPRILYEQACLYWKPTEAILSVLDLILSLFTLWVVTFEPLIAQFPSLANSEPSSISNFVKLRSKLCDPSFMPKQAFYTPETSRFQLIIGIFRVAHKLVQLTLR